MNSPKLSPREPGPDPDTSTAAESEHIDDDIDPEDAPPMLDDDESSIEETPA